MDITIRASFLPQGHAVPLVPQLRHARLAWREVNEMIEAG
jgi:hypothetical protein